MQLADFTRKIDLVSVVELSKMYQNLKGMTIGEATHAVVRSLAENGEILEVYSLEGSLLPEPIDLRPFEDWDDPIWEVLSSYWWKTENGELNPRYHNGERIISIAIRKLDAVRILGMELPDEGQNLSKQTHTIIPAAADTLLESTDLLEKSLGTKERSSLLVIIAALCNYSDIDYTKRGVPGQIARLTDEIGSPITDDTVRTVLAQIPEALHSRAR